jgi:hypothetical protein
VEGDGVPRTRSGCLELLLGEEQRPAALSSGGHEQHGGRGQGSESGVDGDAAGRARGDGQAVERSPSVNP